MKAFLFLLILGVSSEAFNKTYGNKIELIKITRNQLYKGKDLEAIFTITYNNQRTKVSRYFEVIKTDNYLKSFFLADYLLIEKLDSSKMGYYPFGWLSVKIMESDIKYNCMQVINGKVKPMVPN